MGHLLSSAIKMQGGAAAPILQYEVQDYIGGTILVYRNGSVIATLTSDEPLTSVTIANGDTIRMTFTTTGSFFTTFIYYYINGVLQNTYSGTNSIDSGTKTVTSGNTYKLWYVGSA